MTIKECLAGIKYKCCMANESKCARQGTREKGIIGIKCHLCSRRELLPFTGVEYSVCQRISSSRCRDVFIRLELVWTPDGTILVAFDMVGPPLVDRMAGLADSSGEAEVSDAVRLIFFGVRPSLDDARSTSARTPFSRPPLPLFFTAGRRAGRMEGIISLANSLTSTAPSVRLNRSTTSYNPYLSTITPRLG